METIRIDIVNPKAKGLIKNLADLNLIAIRTNEPANSIRAILSKLRNKKATLSFDEIAKEVESVRAKRYGKGR
jgi:hypothetical protein